MLVEREDAAAKLPAQILFGVATMTVAAMVTTYLFGLAYFSATGTYFFRDAFIPVPVFLGMTLLFTDPATSPRSELARVAFGVLYGTFTIALAAILEAAGAPTFFDKLLPIPILSLMARRLDAIAAVVQAKLRAVPVWTPTHRTRCVICDRSRRSNSVISMPPRMTPFRLPMPPSTTMQSSMIDTLNSNAPGVMAWSFAA